MVCIGGVSSNLRIAKWSRRRKTLIAHYSGLGKAIQYLQNHWQELTLFLREPGAPLDNNVCERALKVVTPNSYDPNLPTQRVLLQQGSVFGSTRARAQP